MHACAHPVAHCVHLLLHALVQVVAAPLQSFLHLPGALAFWQSLRHFDCVCAQVFLHAVFVLAHVATPDALQASVPASAGGGPESGWPVEPLEVEPLEEVEVEVEPLDELLVAPEDDEPLAPDELEPSAAAPSSVSAPFASN